MVTEGNWLRSLKHPFLEWIRVQATFRNVWRLRGPSFLGFTSLHLQEVLTLCLHQDSRLMGPFDLNFRDKDSTLKKNLFYLSKIHIA